MKKKLKALVLAGVAVVGLSACQGQNNFRDVEGVKSEKPDYIANYNNMDGHPNMGLICIKGAGFVTTTRDYNAIERVEKWDSFCEGYAK